MTLRARIAALAALVACSDLDVTTLPYAHESPPQPPAPLQMLLQGYFVGGSGIDTIDDIERDLFGNIYVVGGTSSPDFPTTDGSTLDTSTPPGCSLCPYDGFVASFTSSGTLRWARLISSPGYDRLVALKATSSGRIYVGGASGQRPGLAGWHGGLDPAGERGEQDGLVCALSTSDGSLVFCQYLGGTGAGTVTDIDATQGSTIAAVMITQATENLHLDPGYSAAFAGGHRATSAGADVALFLMLGDLSLIEATYVGGSGDERGTPSVRFQPSVARVMVQTETTSSDAPVPGGFDTTFPADGDSAYFAELNVPMLDTVSYGTFLGGNGADRVPRGGIVPTDNRLYLAVETSSTDLPATTGSPQPSHGGNGSSGCGDGDIFLARLDRGTTFSLSLGATRYLGGMSGERFGGFSFARLSSPQPDFGLIVTGQTHSTDFAIHQAAQPVLAGQPCATTAGNGDAFIVRLQESDLALRDGTYLGGAAADEGLHVIDLNNDLRSIVVGSTASSDFPTAGTADRTFGGARDGFVVMHGEFPSGTPDAGTDATSSGDDAAGSPDAPASGTDGGGGGGCCDASSHDTGATAALAALVLLVLAISTSRARRQLSRGARRPSRCGGGRSRSRPRRRT